MLNIEMFYLNVNNFIILAKSIVINVRIFQKIVFHIEKII